MAKISILLLPGKEWGEYWHPFDKRDIKLIIENTWNEFVARSENSLRLQKLLGAYPQFECNYPPDRPVSSDLIKFQSGCILDLDAFNEKDNYLIKEIALIPANVLIGCISDKNENLRQKRANIFWHPIKSEVQLVDYLGLVLLTVLAQTNRIFKEKILSILKKVSRFPENTRGLKNRELYSAQIYEATKSLSTANIDQIQAYCSRIVYVLNEFCGELPLEKRSKVEGVIREIELARDLTDKLGKIELALTHLLIALNPKDAKNEFDSTLVDIVILTILSQEYRAVHNQLHDISSPSFMRSKPNLYAWHFGNVYCPSTARPN